MKSMLIEIKQMQNSNIKDEKRWKIYHDCELMTNRMFFAK